MILDSTFLVDVLRGTADVAERLEDVDATGPPFVSSVTMMELYEGIRLTDASQAEREAVESLLEELTELSFDRECAMKAGALNAKLVAAGNPIDKTDVMIAATALVDGYPVVTRNLDHFTRIEDLEVLDY